MDTAHAYAATLTWSGSTGLGYQHYGRSHAVVPQGAQPLQVSADATFRGDPSLVNPEQLLLAAASSCQLLSFLAVAARAGVDVVRYVDEATAVMAGGGGPQRIGSITLRPRIGVRGEGASRVEQLVQRAHEECYVANSLTTDVAVVPVVEVVA